jgi:hypothetical protein
MLFHCERDIKEIKIVLGYDSLNRYPQFKTYAMHTISDHGTCAVDLSTDRTHFWVVGLSPTIDVGRCTEQHSHFIQVLAEVWRNNSATLQTTTRPICVGTTRRLATRRLSRYDTVAHTPRAAHAGRPGGRSTDTVELGSNASSGTDSPGSAKSRHDPNRNVKVWFHTALLGSTRLATSTYT